MTPEQLKQLIESDAAAQSLALSGADDRCAERVREIAPKQLTSQLWSYRGLSAVLPMDVMDRLIASVEFHIDSGAPFAGVVKEMREFLRKDGLDISNAGTLTMLSMWGQSESFVLTPDDVAAIIDAASVAPTINSIDITNLGLFQPQAE